MNRKARLFTTLMLAIIASTPKFLVRLAKTFRYAFRAALIVALLLLAGCRSSPQTVLKVGADASASFTLNQKEAGLDVLSSVVRIVPSGTTVQISLFGTLDDRQFSGTVGRAGDLRRFRDFYLHAPPNGATNVSGLLRRYAAEAQRLEQRGGKMIVVLISDGGFSDFGAAAAAARELAAIKAVRAVIIGPVTLEPGIQARVVQAFQPLEDSGRLTIINSLTPDVKRQLRVAIRR